MRYDRLLLLVEDSASRSRLSPTRSSSLHTIPIELQFFGVQDEMLGNLKKESQWSTLLLDAVTTQIMSNICGVAELLEYGISRKTDVLCIHVCWMSMYGIL